MPRKCIGRGHFSTCYLNECGKRVTIISRDSVKEAAAVLGFPPSTLFAPIEKIDFYDDGRYVYEMEYLPKQPLNHLKPDQRELYNVLRQLKKNNWGSVGYNAWFDLFLSLPEKFNKEKADLLDAISVLGNYHADNICFEISPRNIRIKDGNLVLLDCFFFDNEI